MTRTTPGPSESKLVQTPAPAPPQMRYRVRKKQMMAQLGVSVSTFQVLMTHGMPHTRFRNLIWFEPSRVHAWLDRFNRVGAPGVRLYKGEKLSDVMAKISQQKKPAAKVKEIA